MLALLGHYCSEFSHERYHHCQSCVVTPGVVVLEQRRILWRITATRASTRTIRWDGTGEHRGSVQQQRREMLVFSSGDAALSNVCRSALPADVLLPGIIICAVVCWGKAGRRPARLIDSISTPRPLAVGLTVLGEWSWSVCCGGGDAKRIQDTAYRPLCRPHWGPIRAPLGAV